MRDRARHQQTVGVAWRRDETHAEALDIVDGIVERMDLQFAAIAGAGIDFANGKRAAEQPARPRLQRLADLLVCGGVRGGRGDAAPDVSANSDRSSSVRIRYRVPNTSS